jgi:putative endonuclease
LFTQSRTLRIKQLLGLNSATGWFDLAAPDRIVARTDFHRPSRAAGPRQQLRKSSLTPSQPSLALRASFGWARCDCVSSYLPSFRERYQQAEAVAPKPRKGEGGPHLLSSHGIEKRLVHVIRSDADPSRHYIGITNNVRDCLEWHTMVHPVILSHRPWSLVVAIGFPSEQHAVRFEKYLKSGSGRAFAKRNFAPI